MASDYDIRDTGKRVIVRFRSRVIGIYSDVNQARREAERDKQRRKENMKLYEVPWTSHVSGIAMVMANSPEEAKSKLTDSMGVDQDNLKEGNVFFDESDGNQKEVKATEIEFGEPAESSEDPADWFPDETEEDAE